MHTIEDVRITEEVFDHTVVTVGCFDGVHLGHQQIIHALLEEARAIGGTPAVMVIEPNPRLVFSPEHTPNILTPPACKSRLLEALGVAVLYTLPFDPQTATMTPKAFVETILLERCRAEVVVVGHDFVFGHHAEGDFELLKSMEAHYGFRARQVAPLIVEGQRVSSTLIRERVVQGEIEDIEVYLGRKFSMSGTVASGGGIGRTLGFPTANLELDTGAVPAHGVYAAEAWTGGQRYKAAVNIGIAPTIRGARRVIEAHLLDFSGSLTGRELELVFHRRLRPENKFSSHDDLIRAIAADVEKVRVLLD